MISEELMSKVWEAYQGDPMDPHNNTGAGLRRVVEAVMEHTSTPSPSTHVEPVGYVTLAELNQLKGGVSCVDLFGEVVPKEFKMVPLYEYPPAPQDHAVPLKWVNGIAEVSGLGLRYILSDPDGLDEGEVNGWFVLEETTNTPISADGSPAGAMMAAQADFERRIAAVCNPSPQTREMGNNS